MNGKGKKSLIKPEKVKKSDAKRIIDFLNEVRTPEEIADAVEFAGERDVGIGVARNILERRAEVGEFTKIKQIYDVPQIDPERFTEIVVALGKKTLAAILIKGLWFIILPLSIPLDHTTDTVFSERQLQPGIDPRSRLWVRG